MFGSSIIDIIIEMTIVIISIIVLFVIGRALLGRFKKTFQSENNESTVLTEEKETNKQTSNPQKNDLPLLKILMNTQNKNLFVKFISLIDKIDWPENPNDLFPKEGGHHSPTKEQLKNYDDKLKRAFGEENKMYTLYLNHLSSNNIIITNTELSDAVAQYKKNLTPPKLRP